MHTSTNPLSPGATAFGYIRVSGDIQADRGLPVAGQRRAIEEYATANNLNLTDLFIDEARPGSSDQRAEFQRMMSLAHQTPPACSAILLWSWSRFSRDQNDAHFWKASLRRHSVQIIDVSGETPIVGGFEYVIESLIHWKDEQRLHEISTSSRRGQQTLAKLGYIPSGARPPRGFMVIFEEKDLEGKKRRLRRWVPDPETWNTVKRAWELRLAGKSYDTIWRECGLYKNPECFNTFFSNPIYKGELTFGETVIPMPSVVTAEEWASGNAGRQERSCGAYPRRLNSIMLLSGLAFCARCGSALVGEHTSKVKRNDGYHRNAWFFYRCRCSRKSECDLPRLDAHKLETAIIEDVLTKILTVNNLQYQWNEISRQNESELSNLQQLEEHLTHQIQETSTQIERLIDTVEHTGFTEQLSSRLKAREGDKQRYEQDLANVRLKLSVPSAPDMLQAEALRDSIERASKSGNQQELRGLLKSFVERVIVDKEEARLVYRLPFVPTGLRPVPQREFESRSQP